jgi:hypothetical protein
VLIHQIDYQFQLLLIQDLLNVEDDHLQMIRIVINVVDFQRNYYVYLIDYYHFHLLLLLVIVEYHRDFQLTLKIKQEFIYKKLILIKLHTEKSFDSLLICSSGFIDDSF